MTDARSVLVKPPQSRRGRGTSTVHIEPAAAWGAGAGRVYVKRQHDYVCHPAWRLGWPTPTLRRELRGLMAARRIGLNVPDVVRYEERDGEATLVLREISDVTPLDEVMTGAGASDATATLVGAAIGRLHRSGWTHGALYSDHILVRPEAEPTVYLIDFEKSRWSPLRRARDLNRFWRSNAYLSASEIAMFGAAYRAALKGPRRVASESSRTETAAPPVDEIPGR